MQLKTLLRFENKMIHKSADEIAIIQPGVTGMVNGLGVIPNPSTVYLVRRHLAWWTRALREKIRQR
jgi:hypothetical protein